MAKRKYCSTVFLFIAICMTGSVFLVYVCVNTINTYVVPITRVPEIYADIRNSGLGEIIEKVQKNITINATVVKDIPVVQEVIKRIDHPVLSHAYKRISKIRLYQTELRKNLTAILSSLENWKMNMTRIQEIRNALSKMNGPTFMFTQSTSPIGRKYYNSFIDDPVVIDKYKRTLLPMVSPFTTKRLFRTCAVVGNGGILRHNNCGQEIDSHDYVIRANLQPIQRFANLAGAKTNLTSINPTRIRDRYQSLHSVQSERRFARDLLEYEGSLLWIPNSKSVNNSVAFKVARVVQQNTTLQILLADAKHFKLLENYWKSKKMLSSGMALVSVGLSLCEELHLYGFWPFKINANGVPLAMHYTNDIRWSSYANSHDYPYEFQLLTRLHQDGVLRLHAKKCTYV
ncbi:alpha-N-acetylneuraminide alpha-2,8-sialyltransferase-like [Saccoglossus kowalevskii]|uniref:Sia-alpha-2,3-Gal-beta-1,4-GlcNAc-R:alpha 2,8-sialyltransferase-like n=1 Tax=Saccoglossus kowalevskii TaxID=10224 RepID=A0ABM0MBK1_SACKO|nr:PREDICTED: sia-alpha-2,3-Gal-beta-1,4-GlcNAc-R:alpha 2,8-sialyltransferase-like [Saccoglossus kowalevskii]